MGNVCVCVTAIRYIVWPFGVLIDIWCINRHLVYFVAIWYIHRYIFPAFVCCSNENLATQIFVNSKNEIG
jgi:hypothetical protein